MKNYIFPYFYGRVRDVERSSIYLLVCFSNDFNRQGPGQLKLGARKELVSHVGGRNLRTWGIMDHHWLLPRHISKELVQKQSNQDPNTLKWDADVLTRDLTFFSTTLIPLFRLVEYNKSKIIVTQNGNFHLEWSECMSLKNSCCDLIVNSNKR